MSRVHYLVIFFSGLFAITFPLSVLLTLFGFITVIDVFDFLGFIAPFCWIGAVSFSILAFIRDDKINKQELAKIEDMYKKIREKEVNIC